jgi:hypothetical protein
MRECSRLGSLVIFGCLITGCGAREVRTEPVQHAATPALSRGGVGNPVKRNFIGMFHPATADWYLKRQRPGWVDEAPADVSFRYGNPNDTPLVGDWDGNGSETPGVWRAGTWYLSNTLGGGPDIVLGYGNVDDVPLVGDWNGDGIDTPGAFRQGTFFLRNSNTTGNGDISFNFGLPGDVPLAGDWDGDGLDTVGVYRPSTATFYLINSNQSNPPDVITAYGNYGGLPIIGDWDGNGLPSLGIWQSGGFYLLNDITSNGAAILGADVYAAYGNAGDIPIAGNWDMHPTNGFAPAPAALTNFFPLGVDFQPSSCFAKWQGRGINTVMRVPGGDREGWADYCSPRPPGQPPQVPETIITWTAEATRLGLQMIRAPQLNPHADDDQTNLLAWDLQDEPEANGPDPATLYNQYTALKAVKPTRPVLFNFTGNYILDLANGACTGPGAYPGTPSGCYPSYIRAEDWISEDYYPVNERVPLTALGKVLDSLTRWSWNTVQHQPSRIQLAVIEASLHDGLPYNGQPLAPAPPTADQFRAEVWLAIIHGARGIIYFPHDGCGYCSNPDAVPADVVTEMTTQNARITSLASVLQSQINPPTLGFRGPAPLEATWRQSGGGNYFIVLNMSTASTSRTMTLFGFTPAHPLTVVGESRSVGAAGSASFTDSFGPYGVHIYQY